MSEQRKPFKLNEDPEWLRKMADLETETGVGGLMACNPKYLEELSYTSCPNCGLEDVVQDGPHDELSNLVCTKDHHKFTSDYGPGENWTEVWHCPSCDHQFEVHNGYP